jgi:maltokinase
MGAITAELHLALASAGTATASIGPLRAAVAERRRQAVDHTAGEVGERLRERLPRIDAALAALDRIGGIGGIDGDVAVQRIHGDLHAGQFLRAGDRLLVIDFDGDPMTASAERLVQQPVERDLAALLQSLDHVARVANKRRPGADVGEFVASAIDAAERAYRDRHVVDDRLLWPLRVAQELHEYAYAALHLPVWTYVPDAAMQALFPVTDTSEPAQALGTTGATDV